MCENEGGKCVILNVLQKMTDVEVKWSLLDRTANSLPLTLRPPQRDALGHIMDRKHVLLNVGMGKPT